jgi:hypothetical protein
MLRCIIVVYVRSFAVPLAEVQDGEGCGIAWEAESEPRGTTNLFRHIPSGVVKSVGKK